MKSFAKEFLQDPIDSGLAPQAFLAAFGKHPGWDDHIDDIGLETPSLIAARQLLYVEGIGTQIGAWEQLEDAARIPFNHLFLWRRESQALIGRFWTSSDGKMRTRYPMVVCAHCIGVSIDRMLEALIEWLEELRARAMESVSADEVRALIAQFGEALRQSISESANKAADQTLAAEELLETEVASDDEAFVKTLSAICGSRFARAKSRSRGGFAPEHFRVPALSARASCAVRFWSRVFASEFNTSVPVLLLVPVDKDWVDAIAGEPTPAEFFCLRASPSALPRTSDNAPEVTEVFRERARILVAQATTGETGAAGATGSSWVSRFFRH
jgi:hypothetical protein